MAYKTLILIDNTSELTTLNQEIIKETVKAFIRKCDKEDKVAIAVTGETAEYLTEYDDTLNSQIKTVDTLEFKDVNAPGADVLMEVLLNWKDSDVAYRDILYISCRDVSIGSDYSEEELLFEVNNKQYPIYTLACVQNENSSYIKSANALSRISGGISVSTDDVSSDAEVEKQLSEKLLQAMKEIRDLEQQSMEVLEEKLESESTEQGENESIGTEEVEEDDAIKEDLEDTEQYGEDDIDDTYESFISEQDGNNYVKATDYSIAYPLIVFAILAVIFTIFYYVRSQRQKKEEEKILREKRNYEDKPPKKREYFEMNDDTETVNLNSIFEDEDNTGTRLLYHTKEGVEITLEDRSNPTKYFRLCVRDSVVIGRSEKMCDLAITYDDSISSRHCELYQRDLALYCRDLGSSNGTMVNQQKVYQEIKIESGDILRIGRLSFFVQILGENYG